MSSWTAAAMKVRGILYLCDGKACGDECPNELCHHTVNLEHALHKDRDISEFCTLAEGDDSVFLVEPDDD